MGPEEHLQEMGIEVVKHSPAVGAHLQDHIWVATSYNCPLSDSMWAMFKWPQTLISQLYKYLRHGAGWLLCTIVEVEVFGMPSLIQADGKPDALSAHTKDPFDPGICGIADPRGLGLGIDRSKGFFGLNCALLKAKSYGRVLLRSRDPTQNTVCEMDYLTSSPDWAALRASLHISVALAHQMRADGYALDDVKVHHYSSSCRMAPQDDPHPGVFDHEFRVHSVSNLRISDACFPKVPATHLQAHQKMTKSS
ncbi:hypothetical protein C8R44DRAFT_866516 [Mycena epipterygia]|nr:hypothetical protein C8R44DRAFT_866516 [Mycena epipterygia]